MTAIEPEPRLDELRDDAPSVVSPPASAPPLRDGQGGAVQRHLHGTWRYLRMHGARAHEADDLTQEAFLIAMRKGALELTPAATAAFLRRTARFLFLRHRRDEPHAIELADAVDERWQRDCGEDDGEALLASLRRCVDALPGRARQAIRRCYGAAATDRDAVAAELGVQPDGLKTLLQRARALLRTCMETRPR